MEDWWNVLKEAFSNPTKIHLIFKDYNAGVRRKDQKEETVNKVYQNLLDSENSDYNGYDPDHDIWYPYKTKNGNTDVFAGIDLDKHPEYLEEAWLGIDTERGELIVKELLSKSYDDAYNSVSRYTTLPDTISTNMLGGLTDLGYLSGSVYSGYPNLSKAVAEGNYPEIINLHEVWFLKKGNWDSSKRKTKVKDGKTYVFDLNRVDTRNKLYFHY